MNALIRDVTSYRLIRLRKGKWLLNVYLIKADPSEIVSEESAFQIIDSHLSLIDQKYMSDEFEYFRTGLAFLHYGNRGVDLTVWHVGRWGNTYEVFSDSWYCYNRETEQMTLLDNAEPVICQYEILLLCEELKIITNTIKDVGLEDDFQDAFISQVLSVTSHDLHSELTKSKDFLQG